MRGDRDLVEGLRARGAEGLGPVYDAYAGRLVSYARTLLRDTAAAEDAVHDSLLAALARIDQLRDPDLLRPWLFAITRNECLRHLRASARFTDDEEAIDMLPSTDAALDAGVRREESARLVDEAMGALNPGDRDVLALALQHDLDGAEVARVTGTPANEIHARLSRARTQLATAVTALLLVRGGGRDCPGLAEVLAGEGATLTPLLRKRVARHARSCETCEERGRTGVALVLPAAGLPAVLAAPSMGLRDRLLGSASDPTVVAAAGEGAGPFGPDGFPVPAGTAVADAQFSDAQFADAEPADAEPAAVTTAAPHPARRRRAALWAAAALVLIGGAVGAALGLASAGDDAPDDVVAAGDLAAAVPGPTPAATTSVAPAPIAVTVPPSTAPPTTAATAAAAEGAGSDPGPTLAQPTDGGEAGATASAQGTIAAGGSGGTGGRSQPGGRTSGTSSGSSGTGSTGGGSTGGRDTSTRRPSPRPATSSATPTSAPAPAPAPTSAPAPVAPAVISVQAVDLDRAADGSFTRCDAFRLRVSATASGDVTGVTASMGAAGTLPLAATGGGTWTGEIELPPGEFAVTVTATGPGGTAQGGAGSVLHICPG